MSGMWLKKSLVSTGALRFASRFIPSGVAVLMYHSVMDDPLPAQTTLGGIVHSTDVFRAQMETIARDFHAVSIDDVLAFLRGEKALPPRAVVVTFDDGYADNYLVARDVLKSLGVPAVFYITVDCIDTQKPPWPTLLRQAFLASKKNTWTEENGDRWNLSSIDHRLRAFERAAEDCSRLSGVRQNRFVESVLQQLGAHPRPAPRLMMSWDEVRALASEGHIVGSHTRTHPNLAHITELEAKEELSGAKKRLEEKLAKPIVHFSYPCPALQPHWSVRTVEASREAGYETAVTTNGGLVRRNDNPLTLRRIRPTKTVEGLRWNLECAFLGRTV